jgi:hypothetical protein
MQHDRQDFLCEVYERLETAPWKGRIRWIEAAYDGLDMTVIEHEDGRFTATFLGEDQQLSIGPAPCVHTLLNWIDEWLTNRGQLPTIPSGVLLDSGCGELLRQLLRRQPARTTPDSAPAFWIKVAATFAHQGLNIPFDIRFDMVLGRKGVQFIATPRGTAWTRFGVAIPDIALGAPWDEALPAGLYVWLERLSRAYQASMN